MKKICSTILILCFFLVSCGNSIKLDRKSNHPLECYDAEWISAEWGISFRISDNGEAFDAKAKDCNGLILDVKVSFEGDFRNVFCVKAINGNELYFFGSCEFYGSTFSVYVTDVYAKGFYHLPLRIVFEQN